MLDRTGRARLLDFGLAHARGAASTIPDDPQRTPTVLDARLTATGALVGTPAFMSPEQLLGEPVGPASDQFSFCVALYEALHRRHPFSGGTAMALALGGLTGPSAAPAPPDIPPRVSAALLRGLARAPASRFASITDLCAALDDAPDLSGYWRERLLLGVACAAPLLGWTIYYFSTDPSEHGIETSLWLAVSAMVTFALALAYTRKTLLRHPSHRARLLSILTVGVLIVVSRVHGFRHDDPLRVVAVRDLMLTAVGITVTLAWITPRTWLTWLCAAIPLLGVLASVLSDELLALAATVSLNGSFLVFLADWYMSGRRRASTTGATTP